MPDDDRVTIEEYDPARDNEPCLALERVAPQGEKYRLSFRRSTYHRRARNFADHRLLVARLSGMVVGVAAVAFKDVVLLGSARRAAFYFDLRVHPEHRRRGVAWRLTKEIVRVGEARSDFGYCYIIADNRAARVLTWFRAKAPAACYRLLVYPTYRRRRSRAPVRPATMAEVHAGLLRSAPGYDLYTDPLAGGNTAAWVASWLTEGGSGCTAWSNESILAEVVEAIPAGMRAAGRLLESWPLRLIPHPHIPRPGEQLRSWYLTDVFGPSPADVADLLRFVSARAAENDIDYLYVPWVEGDDWVETAKADLPRLFAPEFEYLLFAGSRRGPLPTLRRVYVDIRDL